MVKERNYKEIYKKQVNDTYQDNTEKYNNLFCRNITRKMFINKNKYHAYVYKYVRNKHGEEKYQKCILDNLKDRLRNRIRYAFKNMSISKPCKTEELLGASWIEIKEYFESLFTDEINWENFPDWSVDHIKPLAMANNEEDLIKLCHYTNLQPLFHADNRSKSSTYEGVNYRSNMLNRKNK